MKTGRRVVVANNVISDITGGYGLHIWGDFDDSFVINNTVYASAASGFTIGGNNDRGMPDRTVAANNILAGHAGTADSHQGYAAKEYQPGDRQLGPPQPRLGQRPLVAVAALGQRTEQQPHGRPAAALGRRPRPADRARRRRPRRGRGLRAAARRRRPAARLAPGHRRLRGAVAIRDNPAVPGNEQERYAHGLKYSLYDTRHVVRARARLGDRDRARVRRRGDRRVRAGVAAHRLAAPGLERARAGRAGARADAARGARAGVARAAVADAGLLERADAGDPAAVRRARRCGCCARCSSSRSSSRRSLVLSGAYLLLDNPSFNLDAPLVAYRDGRAVWIVRMGITATMIGGALACAAIGRAVGMGAGDRDRGGLGDVGLALRLLAVRPADRAAHEPPGASVPCATGCGRSCGSASARPRSTTPRRRSSTPTPPCSARRSRWRRSAPTAGRTRCTGASGRSRSRSAASTSRP